MWLWRDWAAKILLVLVEEVHHTRRTCQGLPSRSVSQTIQQSVKAHRRSRQILEPHLKTELQNTDPAAQLMRTFETEPGRISPMLSKASRGSNTALKDCTSALQESRSGMKDLLLKPAASTTPPCYCSRRPAISTLAVSQLCQACFRPFRTALMGKQNTCRTQEPHHERRPAATTYRTIG